MITKVNNTVLDLENPAIDALDMGGNVINNAGTPISANDVATKFYVDNFGVGGAALPLTGGTMSGQINMDGQTITNLPIPGFNGDAASKLYVDGFLSKGGGAMIGNINMDGNFVFGLPTPTGPDEAATKDYVDNAVGAGNIVQVINTATGDFFSAAAPFLVVDDTIPQNTDGTELTPLNTTITPASATNLLKIEFDIGWTHTGDNTLLVFSLFQDATADALAVTWDTQIGINFAASTHYTYYMLAGTVAPTTFKIRVAESGSAGTMYMNGSLAARRWGGRMISHMTITEITV